MSFRILALGAGAILGTVWTVTPPPARSPMTYFAQMIGGEETPGNTSKGNGVATLTLDDNKLHYKIEVHNLSGTPTMAHIHVGAMGVAGPPVYTFSVKGKPDSAGTLVTGTIDLSKPVSTGVSGDSLKALLNNGNAYVNVHTKDFPGGEIRGQVKMKM